ncbi:hypothetical protein DRZ77_03255, partial [Candidatus Woesearchaeota archaeon]
MTHITHAINISTCSNLNETGATYYLTADIINSSTSYCINISANNVTLDCQGHTIDGDNVADYGIYIKRSVAQTTNITIKNCVVTDWDTIGVYLNRADKNILTDITLTNPDYNLELIYSDSNNLFNIEANSGTYGIYLSQSDSNSLINISASLNNYGVYLSTSDSNNLTNITANSNTGWGLGMYKSNLNKLVNVTLINSTEFDVYYSTTRTDNDCNNEFTNVIGTDNKPIVFFNDSVNIQNWNNNVSEIILCHADNSIINNLTMNRTGIENNGLIIVATQNTTISNSKFIDLEYGIYLHGSGSNIISNCTVNSNTYGIKIYRDSDNNTIANSTISNNTDAGLYLHESGSNDPEYN